ncbi:MAG: YceI family protein [Deltaproteobacteria bacterium]|nr:MAG: YceI family protein [Deltaproteobacteria bacterium]TMB43830.1 MAG: YceI family protein [Deltaproteobacteria bacterium]
MQGRAAWLAALVVAAAQPKISRPEVVFTAHGSLGMRVEGKTPQLSVTRNGDVLEFAVQLATLQTGIELRDRHMRDEVLEVQRFPVATLRVPNAPLATASTSGTTRAELTVHGQTHPMEVSFQVAQRGGYDVTATFRMDLRDYGMTAPVYLGVKVKPEVDVSADFHLDAP